MRSQPQGIALTDNGLSAERVEELVRFARTLDEPSDPEQLISILHSELSSLVLSNTAALVLSKEIALSGYVLDNGQLAVIPESQREPWQDEICQMVSEQPRPLVVLSLDSSLEPEIRFNEVAQFLRERG